MTDDRLDGLGRLFEEGDALLRTARSAAQAARDPGSDATGSTRVTLDQQGRVTGVTLSSGWKRRLGPDGLGGAVIEAARDAAVRRLTAWGEAYGEAVPVEQPSQLDQDDFQRRLQEAAIGPMSASDREAALAGLLELVRGPERDPTFLGEPVDRPAGFVPLDSEQGRRPARPGHHGVRRSQHHARPGRFRVPAQ